MKSSGEGARVKRAYKWRREHRRSRAAPPRAALFASEAMQAPAAELARKLCVRDPRSKPRAEGCCLHQLFDHSCEHVPVQRITAHSCTRPVVTNTAAGEAAT